MTTLIPYREEPEDDSAGDTPLPGGPLPMMPNWIGTPSFGTIWQLAVDYQASPALDGYYMTGSLMLGNLMEARPFICPPSQLAAVDEDLFPTLESAVDYATRVKLPFPNIVLDFAPPPGEQPAMIHHVLEGDDEDLPNRYLELRAMTISTTAEGAATFCPVLIDPEDGRIWEAPGFVVVHAQEPPRDDSEPGMVVDRVPSPEGNIEFPSFSVSAIETWLGEETTTTPGSIVGVGFANEDPQLQMISQYNDAALVATSFRAALRFLMLLDTLNVEIADVPLTRQERRRAERKSIPVALTIAISRGKRADHDDSSHGGSREFDHQFEVRGNFAHYGPETRLFQHSDPSEIRPCPRCGTCRRVWRRPHIKGPTDKPLVLKARQVGNPRGPGFSGT